ncbi:pentatricopeptide repeat-containing protein [Pyrus ussuriensis x Pyrus communis]|uniref:Pentatricopeptide repeat-containing protein n=1 Tax=Pyrus ussuriensis x Pyrus communis TaxID=2448454 RepID=A0A5N5FBZ6_9ROSA|nr:pentatricopeptide repeat-containing protein [Pyrus ussuriensis x Pyrus communis]
MLDAGVLPDGERVGRIISWFCNGKKPKDAHLVYSSMKVKKQNLPRSPVNLLISSLCKEDETVNLALEILGDLSGEARKYGIKPFSAVVQGLKCSFQLVINGYSKAGNTGEAMKMMKLMESRGLKPEVYTYTVNMSGYANGGLMEEACKILSQVKKKHPKLNPVTYHTIIRGFCRLEDFDEGLKLLGEMKHFGVQPNVDEYNKLIQSLSLKALDWGTAEKLLEEMKDNGLHLNGITKGLIRAVKERLEGEIEIAEA